MLAWRGFLTAVAIVVAATADLTDVTVTNVTVDSVDSQRGFQDRRTELATHQPTTLVESSVSSKSTAAPLTGEAVLTEQQAGSVESDVSANKTRETSDWTTVNRLLQELEGLWWLATDGDHETSVQPDVQHNHGDDDDHDHQADGMADVELVEGIGGDSGAVLDDSTEEDDATVEAVADNDYSEFDGEIEGPVADDDEDDERLQWTIPSLPSGERPNIVIMMADDLDVEMGSLEYMPKLRRFLREEGATFEHSYVTTPLCCPSRSTFLTGMLVHNHQVFTNHDNCSSPAWAKSHEQRTYATYLQQAGYRTGFFGKYMNRYSGERVPPGWHHWSALIGNSKYYNYTLNINGRLHHHGHNYHQDYLPSVVVNESMSFLDQSRRAGHSQPLLLTLSFPTPHGPEDSAPQHAHLFFNVSSHHTPAYNHAPNTDKYWLLQRLGSMNDRQMALTDFLMTKRLQALQSLDDAVQQVYERLLQAGELDRTYIVFTSDHGYHLGQFGLVKGKTTAFEFDIRVPLIVRGPGVPAGSVVSQPVLNVDVTPTLLQMAGVWPPPHHMDGRSLLPLLLAEPRPPSVTSSVTSRWPSSFIVESAGRQPGVRRIKPSRDDGQRGGQVNITLQLQSACQRADYSAQCSAPRQKWACYRQHDRWRIERCSRRLRRQCLCRNGQQLHQLRPLSHAERRRQLRFLRRHVTADTSDMAFFVGDVGQMNVARDGSQGNNSSAATNHTSSGAISAATAGGSGRSQRRVLTAVKRASRVMRNLKQGVAMLGKCSERRRGSCRSSHMRSFRRQLRTQLRQLKQLLSRLKSEAVSVRGGGRRRKTRTRRVFNHNDFDEYDATADVINDEASGDVIVDHDVMDDVTASSDGRQGVSEVVDDDVVTCPCQDQADRDERQWVRELVKQKRQRDRTTRKRARQQVQQRRERKRASLVAGGCLLAGVNFRIHSAADWRTPPLWRSGDVCVCTGAANSSYTCVRTLNATDNWLFCRHVTGTLTYYDLHADPYQLHNVAQELGADRRRQLLGQLQQLASCVGRRQCRPLSATSSSSSSLLSSPLTTSTTAAVPSE